VQFDLNRVKTDTLDKIKNTVFQVGHDILNILDQAITVSDSPIKPSSPPRSTDTVSPLPSATTAKAENSTDQASNLAKDSATSTKTAQSTGL